jgi:hypothetical protein
MRAVSFYRLQNGPSPIEEFVDSLSGKQAQKVLWVLQLIEELDVIPRQYLRSWLIAKISGKSVSILETKSLDC